MRNAILAAARAALAALAAVTVPAAALAALAAFASPASALEIPLTVQDRSGVERTGNHVNAGFPLPQGAVRDASTLALFRHDPLNPDADTPLTAAFVVREKYLSDGSARWVTVHFLASVAGGDKVQLVVKDAQGAAHPFPIAAQSGGNRVTVDTGAIKFVVSKSNFNVIDQAWYDPTGKGKYDKPLIESGAAKLHVNLQNGKYKVVNKLASVDVIGDPVDVTCNVTALELEENTPGRAVVKVAGRFMDGLTPSLDFVARIYAMAASPALRVSFTVINGSGKEWRDFWGINELSLELPVKLAGELRYSISNSAGDDAAGPIKAGETATILQPYSEDYFLGGVASGSGKAKSLLSRRLGWADLTGEQAGVVVGIGNFWQMHPKGLAVSGNGSLSIQLVPKQEKKADVPLAACSEAFMRIDLFTGAARTQEFLLAAHLPADKPRAIALGIIDPLLAVAPTEWYCQKTKAEGLLWDANPDNFKDEYKPIVEAFNKYVDQMSADLVGRRDGAGQGIEEYGLLTYGSGVEHKDYVVRNDYLNTRFDGNNCDYPRAVLVNFWRTGNLDNWETARAAALNLADLDIAHANPPDPKLAGLDRSCPNRGHFRVWPGDQFGVSPNIESTRSQSLYDLYHMTGDGWFLDTALLVANCCTNYGGGALRAVGNRAKGLLAAYEQTGDKKFLDADIDWMEKMLGPRNATQKWDHNWAYGPAAESLADLYRVTGDAKWAQTAVNGCESLVINYWKPNQGAGPPCGITLNCFGYAYEFTGDPDYLRKGVIMLKLASAEYVGRSKAFAQGFRISPYFLHYLTKEYQPPKPVAAKPAGQPAGKATPMPD